MVLSVAGESTESSAHSVEEHVPVLAKELVANILTKCNGVYVDCTFGRGGHARLLLRDLQQDAHLVGIDRDPSATRSAESLAREDPRFQFQQGKFSQLPGLLLRTGFSNPDGVYFDLGISTPQIQEAERGFSFDLDGPLDMRMDPTSRESASEWINQADEWEIADVLRDYGDVRNSKRLARSIVKSKPLRTTAHLADLVRQTTKHGTSIARELAKVFQAIRIEINDELQELTLGLERGFEHLRIGGRLAVITFHGIERGIARNKISNWTSTGGDSRMPLREEDYPHAKKITRGIRPTALEKANNPASRSAMLHVIEKLR